MELKKFDELEMRASQSAEIDAIKKLEARERVGQVIAAMKQEGKALELTAEEIELLEAFRRFKLRMRMANGMFTFWTKPAEGVVIAPDTAEVILPAERS